VHGVVTEVLAKGAAREGRVVLQKFVFGRLRQTQYWSTSWRQTIWAMVDLLNLTLSMVNGERESTALIPVCIGFLTDFLGMIPGALRMTSVPREPPHALETGAKLYLD
jgi:hypothetical protein